MKFFKNSTVSIITFFTVLQCTVVSNAQESTDYQALVQQTELFYGPSDLLNLGEMYYPQNIRANGSPYFVDDYVSAEVFIRNNVFKNVNAKYNVETDQLIIKAELDTSLLIDICAKEAWVDQFRMNKHLFVNVNRMYGVSGTTGYYEEVFKGKSSFFIKYKKEFIGTYNLTTPNGYYSESKRTFFMYTSGKWIKIKNKHAFLKLYGNRKQEVKKFMKENKIKFTKASTKQLHQLMKFCDDLPLSI